MELHPSDFAGFFRSVHNYDPFPWQQALVNRLATSDTWPDVLDLPTGSGKTAALDAAVFHLALRADAPDKAALRMALVVDRRLVVDDAFAHAEKIERALRCASNRTDPSAVIATVARRLQGLAGKGGPPLVAQRLRGGAPLEHDWARTPTQPTILCSTVDQVGSRLLFRGYGVSDRMKPVHAGLLGVGTLILLDEAHLAEPFRQTLEVVRRIGQAGIKVALLSATLGGKAGHSFTLSTEDRTNHILRERLAARKPAALMRPVHGVKAAEAFAMEARAIADRLREKGVSPTAIGIVVNRVALARDVFEALKGDDSPHPVLMIGKSRGVDRDAIAGVLAPFRTCEETRRLARPLVVVATQCLEVGVDLDLDGLVTQAAPLDALRQRFGRLNRAGRPIDAEGAIIAIAQDISRQADDPVYGDRIRLTWDALGVIAEGGVVDFGVNALSERLMNADIDPDDLASERRDAPALMPSYLDLWSQTSPRPAPDPEIGLFLHGAERTAAGVSIAWRADICNADLDGETEVDLKEVFRLVPPRASETIELPLWAVRGWLRDSDRSQSDVSDAPAREKPRPSTVSGSRGREKRAFRWAGYDDPDSRVVSAKDLRLGDLLVVPAEYGGCDRFGWKPESDSPVLDVADEAAKPYWGRRCAFRITRDIVRTKDRWERIVEALSSEGIGGFDLLDLMLSIVSSEAEPDDESNNSVLRDARGPLAALRNAKLPPTPQFPYGGVGERGAILVAERGIGDAADPNLSTPTTEDETASHTSVDPVHLDDHGCRVARFAKTFAQTLGLKDVEDDLRLAGYLHDAGKADPRFQSMLAGGDPWNRPEGPPLAKGGRSWSPRAWEPAQLPKGWRHEALSVRMAVQHPTLVDARDPALVLWLIGSHHGLGRPFFEFHDPEPERPLPCLDVEDWHLKGDMLGPQSLAFDFIGFDWPSLFEDLKRRYGIWGLAHLEAILRLADHRASEEEQAT